MSPEAPAKLHLVTPIKTTANAAATTLPASRTVRLGPASYTNSWGNCRRWTIARIAASVPSKVRAPSSVFDGIAGVAKQPGQPCCTRPKESPSTTGAARASPASNPDARRDQSCRNSADLFPYFLGGWSGLQKGRATRVLGRLLSDIDVPYMIMEKKSNFG